MLNAIHVSSLDEVLETVVLVEADTMHSALHRVADEIVFDYALNAVESEDNYLKTEERWDHPHPRLIISVRVDGVAEPHKLAQLTACILDEVTARPPLVFPKP